MKCRFSSFPCRSIISNLNYAFFFPPVFLDVNLFGECTLNEAFYCALETWQKELRLVVRRTSYLRVFCKLKVCLLAVRYWHCSHLFVEAYKIEYFAICFCRVRRRNEASSEEHAFLFTALYCKSTIRWIISSPAWYSWCPIS